MMKHLLVILFLLPLTSYSQKVFSVDYPNQSDVKVFGENLGEEDRVTLEQIQQRMNTHDELKKVVIGNNSDDVKKEYFNNLFKDTVIDFHGDRQEFYKNVMNKNIYPMMVDFMFKEYMKQLGK